MQRSVLVRVSVIFIAAALMLSMLIYPVPEKVGQILQRLLFLSLFFIVCLLLPSLSLWPFVRRFHEGRLPLSRLFFWGMLCLAFLVFFLVSVLLTLEPSPWIMALFGAVEPASPTLGFLSFLGTVFTFWAAASSAFILLAQLHNEDPQRALRPVTEGQALGEVRLWTANKDVVRITFFGPFSAVPGFWEQETSQSYRAIRSLLVSKSKVPPIVLIGPKPASICKLAEYLTASDQRGEFEMMGEWSETARDLAAGRPQAIESLVARYVSLCRDLKDHQAEVLLARDDPWEFAAITFAIAQDVKRNPIGAIFFGSPIPRDGLAPGERRNIFSKPNIYISRREELGSLLINLESLIARIIVEDEDAGKVLGERIGVP